MGNHEPGEVTRLLAEWSCGDRAALDRLLPIVYSELRRIAAAHLRRERREHTLQPTSLVHEAYLNLADQQSVDCRTRAEFFAIAANVMRQILVNHAKRRKCAKRDAGHRVTLESAVALEFPKVLNLLELDKALDKLAELSRRQCRVVEMRFFAGLREEDIADVLGISLITVKRDWRVAKAMLRNELRGAGL